MYFLTSIHFFHNKSLSVLDIKHAIWWKLYDISLLIHIFLLYKLDVNNYLDIQPLYIYIFLLYQTTGYTLCIFFIFILFSKYFSFNNDFNPNIQVLDTRFYFFKVNHILNHNIVHLLMKVNVINSVYYKTIF